MTLAELNALPTAQQRLDSTRIELEKAVNEIAWLKQRIQGLIEVNNVDLERRREAERVRDRWKAVFLAAAGIVFPDMEGRVERWVVRQLGEASMSRSERAMRLVEEAVELAQAEGLSVAVVRGQVEHVYMRPPGEPGTEAGGVAVTLLGWCAAANRVFLDVALSEIDRVEGRTREEVQASLARKRAYGLSSVPLKAEAE